MHRQGITIVMSTHQMHLVEALCERILLINQGRDVLNGRLGEIQQRFAGHAVSVRVQGELPAIPVDRFEIALPSLDEISIRVVAEGGDYE